MPFQGTSAFETALGGNPLVPWSGAVFVTSVLRHEEVQGASHICALTPSMHTSLPTTSECESGWQRRSWLSFAQVLESALTRYSAIGIEIGC